MRRVLHSRWVGVCAVALWLAVTGPPAMAGQAPQWSAVTEVSDLAEVWYTDWHDPDGYMWSITLNPDITGMFNVQDGKTIYLHDANWWVDAVAVYGNAGNPLPVKGGGSDPNATGSSLGWAWQEGTDSQKVAVGYWQKANDKWYSQQSDADELTQQFWAEFVNRDQVDPTHVALHIATGSTTTKTTTMSTVTDSGWVTPTEFKGETLTPEPTTWALLLLGSGMGLFKRRRTA